MGGGVRITTDSSGADDDSDGAISDIAYSCSDDDSDGAISLCSCSDDDGAASYDVELKDAVAVSICSSSDADDDIEPPRWRRAYAAVARAAAARARKLRGRAAMARAAAYLDEDGAAAVAHRARTRRLRRLRGECAAVRVACALTLERRASRVAADVARMEAAGHRSAEALHDLRGVALVFRLPLPRPLQVGIAAFASGLPIARLARSLPLDGADLARSLEALLGPELAAAADRRAAAAAAAARAEARRRRAGAWKPPRWNASSRAVPDPCARRRGGARCQCLCPACWRHRGGAVA